MRADLLLVINTALKRRLRDIISIEMIERYVDAVLDTFEDQNLFAATLLQPDFDPDDILREMRVFASSASLFGAEFSTGVTAPPEIRTQLTESAERAAVAAAGSLQNQTVNALRTNLFNVITDLDARIAVGEIEYSRVAVQPGLLADSQRITDIRIESVAELQTTRLSAAGGLTNLDVMGATFYRWSAVLFDSCPVCTYLDGMTFQVQESLERINRSLRAENTQDLIDAQPFPDQSRAGLETFLNLDATAIQAGGYAVPPAHPYCRCLVAPIIP